ncbi:MAG: hypothetical protein KGP27_04490 [Hyphomicrobiales bacterium]|nr:hypothetical protein [Hyphomicrobiales bacterium]
MLRLSRLILAGLGVLLTQALLVSPHAHSQAQEDFGAWALLTPRFESTGGGGIMIGEYEPVVAGDKCRTDFTATEPGPNGKVYYNSVEFDAVPAQGGILCTNGRWRARDGSVEGTTPLRVFIKDGVRRRSP